MMEKQEVIERLCDLCADVGEHFEYYYAADCFCDDDDKDFRFEEEVLEFIENAVKEKISCR